MKKFVVNSDRLVGRDVKMLFKGQTIDESQINPSALPRFIASNRISELKDYSISPDRKIKLAIVTSVWGRPEVVKLFVTGVENLIEKCTDFEIQVIVSGSIQDEERIKKNRFRLLF